MELEKAINGRRSVREYQDKEVPESSVKELLSAGAMAPSAMNKQPCHFIVISSQKKMGELSEKVKSILGMEERLAQRMKSKEDVIFYSAPLLIAIVAEKNDWAAADTSLAAQNMMLRAYDLGLGSCFIGFANSLNRDRETLRSLGMEDSQEIFCPLIFGYPKAWPAPKIREAKIQKRI